MKNSVTLNLYLAKIYLFNFLFLLFIFLGVVYLFDTVELLRRAGKHDDIPLTLVLQMGLLKLPEMEGIIAPFVILFSGIYTFWQLTRRSELIIMRAAGFSAWQFLAPIITLSIFIGVLQITLINPIGAMFVSRFEVLENIHLERKKNLVSLFDEGLWLRQQHETDYIILHADKISLPDWELKGVFATEFSEDDIFKRRIDAPRAELKENKWVFYNTTIHSPGKTAEHLKSYALPTQLSAKEIEESFSSPQTMSFWRLPSFIKTMEATGFDATLLKIHYQILLSKPLLFAAMILLAASVALRSPRSGFTLYLISGGIFAGFAVFFLSSFLQALGASQQIPVFLASWSPSFICLLLGGTVILSLEDG